MRQVISHSNGRQKFGISGHKTYIITDNWINLHKNSFRRRIFRLTVLEFQTPN
jgi:hypothetical protein